MTIRILVFAAGALIVTATLGSAVRAVVLPRPVPARITRRVFLAMRRVFKIAMGHSGYERRDGIMARYGPASLIALLATWLVLEIAGFAMMFWGLGHASLRTAFVTSGSSITTLGFQRPADLPGATLSIAEALIGLVLLALLITYLPSIYAAFSRREQQVTGFEVMAGYPPHARTMLERVYRVGLTERLPRIWERWLEWFGDIEETHTTFPVLAFFRSQSPYHSWVVTAGAVLDAAALHTSCVRGPNDPDAQLCIRAGYVALRRIATFFRIPFDPDPRPDDPISIERAEFDAVYDELAALRIPLHDRDQAWRDFAGWRVNYDTVLVELCALVMAPPAEWSSDRLARAGRPPGPGDQRIAGFKGRTRGPRADTGSR